MHWGTIAITAATVATALLILRSYRADQAARGLRGAIGVKGSLVRPWGAAPIPMGFDVAQVRGVELLLMNRSDMEIGVVLHTVHLRWPRKVTLQTPRHLLVVSSRGSQQAPFGLGSTKPWADDVPERPYGFYRRRCFLTATFLRTDNQARIRYFGFPRMYRPSYKRPTQETSAS